QRLGARAARRPGAHDDDRSRATAAELDGERPTLAGDDELATARRDVEARDGIQRGRAGGRPRVKRKGRVVPGAANLVADDEALAERSAIVRALRAHGEDLGPATHEQHGLAMRVPHQRPALWHRLRIDALREIRPLELL